MLRNVIYGTKQFVMRVMLQRGLQGVFSAKTTHPGGILMDAPEPYRNATQFAGGMSRVALSGTDSHCQSM